MRRKQIYLDQSSDVRLKRLAKARGVSEAALIREAIADYLAGQDSRESTAANEDPLLALIGLYKGEAPSDGAVNHDRYLYPGDKAL